MKRILSTLVFVFIALAGYAQAPQLLNYQGVARNSSGIPLGGTSIGLQLTIHDGSAGGTVVYQETQTTTTNGFGLYNVSVGGGTVSSGTFIGINWAGGPKYMEVGIDPAGGSSYTSAGTAQLLSVPYSIYANTAGSATGAMTGSGTTNNVVKFTSSTAVGNSSLFDNGTSVGLGTITPSAMSKIEVSGVGTLGALPYFLAGIVADGTSTSSASGIYGEGGWRGVYGRNPGTYSGSEAMGVMGRCEGSSYVSVGYGVKGENVGTGGSANYGTYGMVTGTTGINIGAYGSGNTAGVYGIGNKTGVYGTANGIGTAWSTLFVNLTPGIVGLTRSVTSGVPLGVYGTAANATSTAAVGVLGFADSNIHYNYGLYGYTGHGAGTAIDYGVYASTDGTGAANYAGYFVGAIYASSASASIKSFKIDHPADPANKYLYHSSVESNDMMNLYKGHVVTDAGGNATVTLPSYFTALNKEYDYQLTCIGQFAQAIVSEEISNNQFKIKTDKPNVKVSWQVAGVRQDPAANAYRIQNEVEKPAPEKGTYLMPELYGYGPEMAPGYRIHAKAGDNADTNIFPTNLQAVMNAGDNTGK